MYKNKKDVDKHVEKLLSKLSPKDFNARAYTVARLYFEVGDYGSCQKYLEQYLTYKANNAAAHKLLGLTFRKLGLKDKALEELKISLDLDPGQTNIILDICELLADDDVIIEAGRARYWCEKAELAFPKHPITFKLRERLLAVANPNPEAIVNLLTSELAARPNDAVLHVRLLKHYLSTNKMKEAFDHSCNVEFENAQFLNNIIWYETLSEVLKCNTDKIIDWLYQLLLLTVKERLCTLSETEVPQGSSMSLMESKEFLQEYDQAIVSVTKAGPMSGYAEFHSHLLRHHRGQFAFLAATLLLKRAKKEKLNWYDATKYSSLLLLTAWQTSPIDPHPTWLTGSPEKQKTAVLRWYREASYRCSQSGHMILGNNQEKGHLFLDQISQFCSSNNWKDKLFENIYVSKDERAKAESYITSNSFQAPSSKLPQKLEVQAFDDEAQKLYPNSLHHFVWILSNYSKLSDFKCTIFDMLSPSITSCGPESLSKLDILAFLYSATLSAKKQKEKRNYIAADVPTLIPANISDLLCSLPQIKWWDCAYKFTQNELGSEYTDIRSTLSRGIEVVRCVDNHGLDPELLCILGGIFSSLSKQSTIDDKSMLESRAYLYYASAVPLLEKLKSKSMVKLPSKRLFAYSHNELDNKQLNTLLHESKLYIALKNYNDDEYVKAIEYLTDLKSPESYFYLGASYLKIANEEKLIKNNDRNSKFVTLLGKSKYYAYKALEAIKKIESYKFLPLFSNIQDLIEDVESSLGIVDSNISFSVLNDGDTKFSSDENVSEIDSAPLRHPYSHHNLSSTPKVSKNQVNLNSTNYRTALDSQVFNNSHVDQQNLKVIEEQIKSLQKRDATIEDFKEQTRNWFDENRRLGNQIINTIHSNIEQTTEQFKLLKLSVEEVKDQVSECRKECKDVAELKKQIADLKREVNKLKKSEQTIDESDLYNLNDDYRSNDNPTFPTQIPFAPPPVIPPFAQRLVPPFPVPPNPYQLYGQNFCNLYNQFSQLTQNTAVPVSSAMFNPNQGQPTYPGIYPASDQMYLEMANLVQPGIPQAPVVVPNLPSIPVVSIGPTAIVASTSSAVASKIITPTANAKPVARSLPVNVVITTSDPLPSCTTTPAPILSVTIPQKHIKGSPHNYQIQMPSTTEAKSVIPPIFNLSGTKEAIPSSTLSENLSLWNKPAMSENFFTSEVSKSVIDGPYKSSSPNTSLNKSRTLSEKSNTSVENYDPCPDFKPIIPLPAEVKVTTGEENETSIFSARAKLFRFVDKQWKERGIGEMKLLKHNVTGKVRVLMRREQVHKICANHIIVPEMEIKPMKNEAKAYFWVANDFAEESLILEKFCIRFKTADTAKEFFDAFEKARSESSSTDVKTNENIKEKGEFITSNEDKSDPPVSKPTIGGFTFSSTPSFKTVIETPKKEAVKDETPTSKVNVFSGITFKNATSSPFGNVLGTASSSAVDSKDTKSSGNANTSDLVEEFEPTAEFKPVVPLPALVDQKTGEEDEIVLFEHRAKLLRFDGQAKEWKERGLGNIKLLKNKENNQKVRLLMRREQIMKVCCNHAITKDITFVKMPNIDKAVTWCAKDFSEGELTSETFCLRFKTVQSCNDFIEAVKEAQANMGEDVKAVEKEENVSKSNSSGFGNQFKPKPGSWYCTACYTNNLESFTKCACCEQPKPSTPSIQPSAVQTKTQSWGDQFKPKPGSWECKQCLVRNQAESVNCSACNSPGGQNLNPKSDGPKESAPKFNFGITQPAKPSQPAKAPAVSGWGDKFKPKEGSWECQQCFVRNEKDKEVCPACNSPRNPGATTTPTPATTPKFSFGIPQKAVEQTAPVSLFNTNASQTFKFGIAKESTPKPFGDVVDANGSEAAINFSAKKTETDTAVQKPALLPTPTSNLTFGSKEGGSFNFALKPKSPTKGKSPMKSPKSKGDESGDEEYVSDDEGASIHFSPVIPMPDKIDVVTGEENEVELYGHRAKLFIFTNTEWKERGLGIIKILKHKKSGNLRVLMRREQVHKICLNHILSPDVIYKPKDEKTWFFAANDFSEGELHLQQFCVRFQNKTIALEFKNEIDKAIQSKFGPQKEKDDDVIFVSETEASEEDKQRAKELMLPDNFFTYSEKEPCKGCRGCEEDIMETPRKPSKPDAFSSFAQSTTNSVYGTPLDRTIDTTTFGTPLTSIFKESDKSEKDTFANRLQASTKSSILAPPKLNTSSNDDTSTPKSKEQNQSLLGLKDPNTSLFGSPKEQSKSVFGSTEPKKSIFGSTEQNKSVFGTIFQSKPIFGSTEQNKSVFGTADQNKPVFGSIEQNKSVFGTADQSKPVFGSTEQNKSVFGTADQNKPIFGSTDQNKSVFGTADQSKSIFGSTDQNKSVFGTADQSKSIFGSTDQNKSVFGTADQSKPVFGSTEQNKSVFGTADQNKPIFGSTDQNKSVFGTADQNKPIFGSTEQNKSVFGTADQSKPVFGSTEQNKSVFGTADQNKPIFGSTEQNKSVFGTADQSKSIFGSTEQNKSMFGTANQNKPIFGSTDQNKSVFGSSDQSKPIFGSTEQNKSIFGSADQNKPIFGSTVQNKPIFGSTEPNKSVFANNEPEVKSIFSTDNQKPVNYFSNPTQGSLFGPTVQVDGKPSDVLGQANTQDTKASSDDSEISVVNKMLVADSLSFADLSKTTELGIQNKPNDFKWEGAGLQLFSSARDQSTDNDKTGDDEYDPHYEPIVPLPDKIIVTTGEEDEEKIFGERCKLYRFDEKSREWKERGVGEMKILYHPHRQTYRLLLRREQVHKAVLNMLIFMDLELLPMKNSNSAWTWAGNNYVDGNASQETLAVRFKSVELASNFRDKVLQCVRKLQVAAADAIRKEKEEKENPFGNLAPLRLPKGMAESSRADVLQGETSQKENGEQSDGVKQVHFETEEDYEHDYDEDYDGYYNEEEEEESAMYYACDGEVILEQEDIRNTVEEAHIQVLFDHDVCSPKILITDNNTGEILADMLIHTDTVFQISGDSCSWSGFDYTSNIPANKTVTVNFPDSETTMDFYDSCETSKASTYESHDPES